MTTLSLADLTRDERLQGLLNMSSIEANVSLAQLFHDDTELSLELADRFAAERWGTPVNDDHPQPTRCPTCFRWNCEKHNG